MSIQQLHPRGMPVELYYLGGMVNSRKMVFPLLLAHADQDDLKQVKKDYGRMGDSKFNRAIKEAMKKGSTYGNETCSLF